MAKAEFDARFFMASVRKEVEGALNGPLSFWEFLALLRLRGTPFLRAAYMSVLFREIDATGSAAYAERAKTLCGRIRILLILFLSPETTYVPPFLRWILTVLRLLRRGRE